MCVCVYTIDFSFLCPPCCFRQRGTGGRRSHVSRLPLPSGTVGRRGAVLQGVFVKLTTAATVSRMHGQSPYRSSGCDTSWLLLVDWHLVLWSRARVCVRACVRACVCVCLCIDVLSLTFLFLPCLSPTFYGHFMQVTVTFVSVLKSSVMSLPKAERSVCYILSLSCVSLCGALKTKQKNNDNIRNKQQQQQQQQQKYEQHGVLRCGLGWHTV